MNTNLIGKGPSQASIIDPNTPPSPKFAAIVMRVEAEEEARAAAAIIQAVHTGALAASAQALHAGALVPAFVHAAETGTPVDVQTAPEAEEEAPCAAAAPVQADLAGETTGKLTSL